ncbi:MAG: hypothetical protein J5764_02210 [Bacteroidales bacterium]|nr:hypothetical protein [Bacteroidales bacterium]
MKRYLVLACILPLLASCTIFEQFSNDLRLSISRESFKTGEAALWQTTDKILVLSESRSSGMRMSLQSGAGTEQAVFSGEKPGSAPYIVVFPYSSRAKRESADDVRLTLQSSQKWYADYADPAACISLATASGNENIRLLNLQAILEIPVVGYGELKSVSLTVPEGGMLWGETLTGLAGTPTARFTSEETAASRTLSLDLGSEGTVELSSTPVYLRFALLPEALLRGATLEMFDSENGSMQYEIPALRLQRTRIHTLDNVRYARTIEPVLNETTCGVYRIASGKGNPIYTYIPCENQFALRRSASGLTYRIQNLSEGKLLSVSFPADLSEEGTIQVEVAGIEGCPSGRRTVEVAKRADSQIWLSDLEGPYMYIVMEEV